MGLYFWIPSCIQVQITPDFCTSFSPPTSLIVSYFSRFSLSVPKEMYREQQGEYAYWYLGCKGSKLKIQKQAEVFLKKCSSSKERPTNGWNLHRQRFAYEWVISAVCLYHCDQRLAVKTCPWALVSQILHCWMMYATFAPCCESNGLSVTLLKKTKSDEPPSNSHSACSIFSLRINFPFRMYFLKLFLYLLKAQTKLLLLFSLVKLRMRIKSQIRVSRFRTDETAIN